MVDTTVAEIMNREPTSVRPAHTVLRAMQEFELGRIRHLPVVDDGGILVGVLSERDVHDIDEAEAEAIRVDSVMGLDVLSVRPDTPAHEVAYLLLRHAIGSVPITESDGRLVGIVTTSDFVRIAYRALGGKVPVEELEEEEREADRV